MTDVRTTMWQHLAEPTASERPALSGHLMGALVVISLLIDAWLMVRAHLRVEVTGTVAVVAGWAGFALAICYTLRKASTRPHRFIRDLVEGISLFALVSLLGAIASYPLAAGSHVLVDPVLERIDVDLHFDWVRWYEVVAHHVWLQTAERAAYLSIFVTPAVLIVYHAWSGRPAETRLFVATFWLAAFITLALFPLLPAAGPFSTLWHGSTPYMPLSAFYQDEAIVALRSHRLTSIDLGALHGLVCAPSFHAASAIIYMAAAWRIRLLRWPITALNLAMLLATPVEGTHYLADLLAGVAVACFALWLAPTLVNLGAIGRIDWPARRRQVTTFSGG